LHHQAIQQPAPQVRVVAKAPDGVIEAIEIPERRFAIGVQWHPEDIADDAIQMRLFEAFVEATRNGHRG
ncbi:MAG: gamma-glutamyl-gamma-aminobutyrate hydrolase family protein, partial [Chloroflexi bacterium]